MKTLLIQASPLALAAGTRTLVNIGDGPSSESYGVGGTSWQPAVVKRPQGSLEIFSPDMDGTIEAGTMEMTISLKDLKTLPAGAQTYYWQGAPVTIYSTDNYDLSTATLEFVGNITSETIDYDTLDLNFTATVSTSFIQQPLLTKSFGGSGGIDGDAGKRGTLLPAGFGSVHNIQPIWFDATNNIGMIDGYGNCTAITWCGEGLSTLGPAQGNYASYAALVTAIQNGTVKPGQWATCVAQGLIGLGAPAVGIITCHATFGANRPGAMMLKWIGMIGLSGAVTPVPAANIDTAAFNTLDVACPYPVHHWTADQALVSDLLKQMCASVNASPIVTFQGLITVTRAVLPTNIIYSFLNNQLNGFTTNGGAPLVAGAGGATIAAGSTNNFYLSTPNSANGFLLDSTTHFIVQVDLMRTAARGSGGTWGGLLFWSNSSHGFGQFIAGAGAGDPPLNVRTTLTWNIATDGTPALLADWMSSKIQQIGIRLDNGSASAPQGGFTIYGVTIVTAGAGTINRDGSTTPIALDWTDVASDPPYYAITARAARPASVLTIDQVNYGVEINDRGGWNATTVYSNGDLVWLPDGSSYLYTNSTPSSGNLTSNTTYWTQDNPPTVVDFATAVVDKNGSTAKADLITEAANALAGANSANAAIAIIAADGYLSKGEKRDIITDVTSYTNERPVIEAQATTLGVSSTAYETAYQALISYLNSLSPAWNDVTQDTAINSTTFKGKFSDYLYARAALTTALANAAAQTVAPTNRVIFSLFERGTLGWMIRSNPSSISAPLGTGSASGVPYLQVTATATAANQSLSIGTASGYYFSVTAGERVWVQVGIQVGGQATSGLLVIGFYDASGKSLSQSPIWSGASAAAFTLVSAPVVVPVNAVSAYIELYGTSSASGSMILGISQPLVTSISQAQGSVVPFVAGPNAVPGADQTGQNTSADTSAVSGTPSATVIANITAAGNLANTANATAAIGAQLASDVADNTKFSATEKKRWVEKINSLDTTVANEITQGNALGLQTQTAALQTAYTTLKNYLVSVNYNVTPYTTTTIAPATFKANVAAFDAANTALANAAQQYAATASAAASQANLFLDPAFSRLTDKASWASVTAGAVVSTASDGPRINFPAGNGEIDLTIPLFALGNGDRVDVEFEYYVDSGVTSNTLFGIAVQGFDGTASKLWGSIAPTLTVGGVPARGTWLKATASVMVNQQASYANTALGNAYILCQALTGGTVYIRNPRAYITKASQQLLGTNGRGTSALLNSTSIVAGIKVVNNTGFVLSSTLNGTTNVTVNIGAFTYTTDSGLTISYPSGSFPGLAFSTTYYVWRVDPALNGGTSYGISTSLNDAAKPGQLYVGYIITPNSSGTGGGGAGGGANGCVTEDMWVATEGGDVMAKDIKAGDMVWCLTDDMESMELAPVISNSPANNWCITIRTANGVELDLAVNTPMTPRNGAGGVVMAANVWAQEVATRIDGVLDWDSCTISALPDMPTVAQIDLGGRTFAAGKVKGSYIFSHNGAQKP